MKKEIIKTISSIAGFACIEEELKDNKIEIYSSGDVKINENNSDNKI